MYFEGGQCMNMCCLLFLRVCVYLVVSGYMHFEFWQCMYMCCLYHFAKCVTIIVAGYMYLNCGSLYTYVLDVCTGSLCFTVFVCAWFWHKVALLDTKHRLVLYMYLNCGNLYTYMFLMCVHVLYPSQCLCALDFDIELLCWTQSTNWCCTD